MGVLITFPKTTTSEKFFHFMIRYQDGAEFYGADAESALRKQKDAWEPEISMKEYFEKLRDRLLFITGKLYEFKTADELISILEDLEFIEVFRNGKIF